ncbi:RNA-binding motif protein, X-linked 2 [Dermatophagoides pteronyssinus]|uniref:RNA-binding motif protein, X-linked 2-like n=2 Tax=Dermatophagoides pteronyssinus TaxID=6956 RepID=A0A6P6Y4V7_DERPT|nr:RNA-binding motif protein, X-linked 2-like [Dermatophagoides pteronyssinus]KAH9424819.1 RNA-binding motif protein, X-linked 2 [Dermatophagoides pteronyssinus]
MNPLTNVKNLAKLCERELEMGIDVKHSWHQMYKNSAWIFIGGLHYDLSEGDVLAVFSQYGEIVNINLVRDRKTGKSRGFAFLCYQDQRSTILAVDNFNGIKLLNRIIRVDHVEEYKIPKEFDDITNELKELYNEGCAPKPIEQPSKPNSNEIHHELSENPKKSEHRHKDQKRKKQSRSPEKSSRSHHRHSSSSSKKHKKHSKSSKKHKHKRSKHD